jgi:septal ring factor EnvC (AmiA/AmiB activator)
MGPEDTTKSSIKKPNLYVELRRHGEPINPLPWLTANNRKVAG